MITCITDHAQDHLGDVVYVELPEVGNVVKQGASFGAVESVDATSDIFSLVTGQVVEVNQELNSFPGLVSPFPVLILCSIALMSTITSQIRKTLVHFHDCLLLSDIVQIWLLHWDLLNGYT